MKKILFAIIAVLSTVPTLWADEKVIDQSALPQSAQTFVSTHYPSDKVSISTMERDGFTRSYKVILTNGVKVEFDDKGDWTEVKSKGKQGVAESVVPDAISQYVKDKFPSNRIVQIERDKRTIEVELNGDIDLTFNLKGDFIGY
ncbi:MAG: PepSY-like domain-containing protein [Rikenellaceae bacterium]